MIDKELELYYRNFRDMFVSEGWKQLQRDLQDNADVVNAIELVKDVQDLFFRKGQLAIIAGLLNLEAQIQLAEEDAIETSAEGVH